jgi:hypothetical protein
MYFDGTSFIQTSIDNVYSGNSDFTLEFFVRPSARTGAPVTQTLFYIGEHGIADTYKFIGSLVSNVGNTSFSLRIQVSTVFTMTVGELYPEQWHHVAVMRFGNIMYFYINGQRVNYKEIPQNIPASGAPGFTTYLSGNESVMTIGGKYNRYVTQTYQDAFVDSFMGHMTNFRWTKGMAVYTEPIGVPPLTTLVEKFKTPVIPLFIYSRSDGFTHLYRYVSVGLLAESADTLLYNTRSPTATVSITDANTIVGASQLYNKVKWVVI